jgi:ABC-type nickel/cobalt efflux system permease component RcnA
VISALLSPGLDVFIGQAIVGGLGLFILWRRWREGERLALAQAEPGQSLAEMEA